MPVAVKIVNKMHKVKKYVEGSTFATVGDAARVIRSIAMKSIRNRGKGNASSPGEPPRTRSGQLRRSIQFNVEKGKISAVIGPIKSRMGPAAAALEKGGMFRGEMMMARPFMRPALERVIPMMPKLWQYSVRG